MSNRTLGTIVVCWVSLSSFGFGQAWYSQYKSVDSIYSRLDLMATDHPSLVTPVTYGQSYEGRDLRAIKISGPDGTRESRPAVLLNGTQHAREWISPMTTMYAADTLLDQYQTDPTVKALLDEVDVYVLPMVNPDGYEYSRTVNRQWRKNRRPVGANSYGVDLNRNWDYGWGLDSGSSNNPDSLTYRGPSPFSEPETMGVRDFYLDHQNIVSNIDFHAYSQLILYPFGFSDVQSPDDQAMLNQVAIEMSDSIFNVHGQNYIPESASDLYLASGLSIDWTYGSQKAYSYTVELRPRAGFPGFELPANEILPTAEEAFAGVMNLIEFTYTINSGDFNYDGNYDCTDLDLLSDAILNGTGKAEFDVDGDAAYGLGDLNAWLVNAGSVESPTGAAFYFGDANLDGVADVGDYSIWNDNKFGPGGWCDGDFNADGYVDVSDYTLWSSNKFQVLAAVPEPSGWTLAFIAILIPGLRRRSN